MAMTSQNTPGSRELPGPVHHVFVDFENVQEIDLTPFTGKAVQVTILLGKTQRRLEVSLVQEILKRPGGVRLIEMTTAGKNALDLALAYHLGMAAIQDPAGCFHIISRDKDYDPLIAHLKRTGSKAFRHDKFSVQAILGTAKPAGSVPIGRVIAPARRSSQSEVGSPAGPDVAIQPDGSLGRLSRQALESHPRARSAGQQSRSDKSGQQRPAAARDKVAVMVDRLRKNVATRPKQEKRLLTHVKAQFRGKLQDGEAEQIVESLVARGAISIDSKGKVTYRLLDGAQF
jgi:hypothetical protein